MFDDVDLPGTAKIAGINSVETDVFFLPVLGDRPDLIRQILAGKAFEQGVGAEDGCRQNHRFDPHGGQQRQSHGQGAFAKAGDILDGQYSFHDDLPPFL